MTNRLKENILWVVVCTVVILLFVLKLTSFEKSNNAIPEQSKVEYEFIHSDVREVEIVNAKGKAVTFIIEPEARGKVTMDMLESMADTHGHNDNIHIWDVGGLAE